MKKVFYIVISLALVVSFANSCGKKKGCTDPYSANYDSDAEEDDGSCSYVAGTGGSVLLRTFPKHHNVPIVSDSTYPDSAFIKFNTSNLPGTSPAAFDLIAIGLHGKDHVEIPGLKRGKYFIFMTGWDANISQRVTGGIPFEIEVSTGTVNVDVPVVE